MSDYEKLKNEYEELKKEIRRLEISNGMLYKYKQEAKVKIKCLEHEKQELSYLLTELMKERNNKKVKK